MPTITDPRKAHTLSEFLMALSSSTTITYPKLSFVEKRNNIEYVVKNVLSDYIYELKQRAATVTLSTQEEIKYFYRPKLLASDLYGSTELYYVILLLNDMCDVKDFTMNPLKLLYKDDMAECLSVIYNAEKNAISTYNSLHT